MRIVLQEPFVFGGAEVVSPDYAGSIDVGGVVNPLTKTVARAVVYEDQLLTGCVGELLVYCDAAFGVAVVDVVPGLVVEGWR